MFHGFYLNGTNINLVTIAIAVIGILVPILFAYFIKLILHRNSETMELTKKEMKDFMFFLQKQYAEENIAKRYRTG